MSMNNIVKAGLKSAGALAVGITVTRTAVAAGKTVYTNHIANKEGWDDDKLIAAQAKLKLPQKLANSAIGLAAMSKTAKTAAKIATATYFEGPQKGTEVAKKEALKTLGKVGFAIGAALTTQAIVNGAKDLCNDIGLTAYGEKYGGLEVDLFNGDGCYGLQENDRKEVNSETDKLLEFN